MKGDKEIHDRFSFKIKRDNLGKLKEIQLGEESSRIVEDIYLSSPEVQCRVSNNELILIYTMNQFEEKKYKSNGKDDNEKWISQLSSYIKKRSKIYFASIWKTKDNKIAIARVIYQLKVRSKKFSLDFLTWGSDERYSLEWSIILPSEILWSFDIEDAIGTPNIIGKKIYKEFDYNFSGRSSIGLKNIYKGKNKVTILPHTELPENGSIRGELINYQNIPSFKITFGVPSISKILHGIIKGPILELFEVPRGSSRFCSIIKRNDWVYVLGILTCLKHFSDWKYKTQQRFSRGRDQTFTPILFYEGINNKILDFVIQEYRVKHLLISGEIPKLLKNKTQIHNKLKSIDSILTKITDNQGKQLFSIIKILLEKQRSIQYYPTQLKFDCIVVVPDDPKIALLTAPFIRYLNAIPVIFSSQIIDQLESYRADLYTNFVIIIGIDLEESKRIVESEGFEVIYSIESNDYVEILNYLQKKYLLIQVFDYFLEDLYYVLREIPTFISILDKYIQNSDLQKLLKYNMENKELNKEEFISKSIKAGLLIDFSDFQKLYEGFYYLMKDLIKLKGLEDHADVVFTNFTLLHQHAILVSLDLPIEELINVALYATSKKLHILPILSPPRKIRRRLHKIIGKIHETMEKGFLSPSDIYKNVMRKFVEYSKVCGCNFVPQDCFKTLYTTINPKIDTIQRWELFRYLSLFPSEKSVLYEKMGTPFLDEKLAIGRMVGENMIETNTLVLRAIVNKYLPQKEPNFFFATSLVDNHSDQIVHEANSSLVHEFKKLGIKSSAINVFDNYNDFLKQIQECTNFFYWGHGTSFSLKLIDSKHSAEAFIINTKLIGKLSNPDGKICILTSCQGGKTRISKQMILAEVFRTIGFNSVIASCLKVPVLAGLNFHLNFILNLAEDIPIGVLLSNFKKQQNLPFSEWFILYGDPSLTFPRFFHTDAKEIRTSIDSIFRKFLPEAQLSKIKILK